MFFKVLTAGAFLDIDIEDARCISKMAKIQEVLSCNGITTQAYFCP